VGLFLPEKPAAHTTALVVPCYVLPTCNTLSGQEQAKLNHSVELLLTWKRTVLGFERVLATGASNKMNHCLQ